MFGSSRLHMFFKICPLKNVANFTRKNLCRSLFLIKLQARQGQALIHLLIPELLPLFISIFLFLISMKLCGAVIHRCSWMFGRVLNTPLQTQSFTVVLYNGCKPYKTPANSPCLSKKKCHCRFFPVSFSKFLRIAFLQNTSRRLHLFSVVLKVIYSEWNFALKNGQGMLLLKKCTSKFFGKCLLRKYKPSRHLLVQSQQWKHQNNVWNLF